jgi:putative MATE family efflux protein
MRKSQSTISYNGITEGVIWKQLLFFFFPILLGTFFQQLYNTVDTVIVGNFLGKEALAAVGGGTSTVINLLIGFFTGLASGATVVISQYFGAKDDENVHKSIHTAIALSLWGGIIISIAGYLTAEPLLRLIDTPEDIMPLALSYIHIYFAGGIFIVMYNIGAGIFRAFGDSKSPLYFLIAGCLLNIVLDLLFVGPLQLGVKGAAYATVLSQVFSLVLVTIALRRKKDCCKLIYKDIKFEKHMLKKTIYIGLPAGLQSVLYTVSNLIIQADINGFGTDAAAAWAAYGKLDCFFWMILQAFGIAITTFVGQNYGAGQIQRSKKGVRTCLYMTFGSTLAIEAIYLTFSRYGFMLFVSDTAVIDLGVGMLNCIVPFYFTYIFIEILSGAIRGTGKSLVPTLITVFGICVLRVIWLAIVPAKFGTINSVMLCYPVTWTVTSLAFFFYYKFGNIYDNKNLS